MRLLRVFADGFMGALDFCGSPIMRFCSGIGAVAAGVLLLTSGLAGWAAIGFGALSIFVGALSFVSSLPDLARRE